MTHPDHAVLGQLAEKFVRLPDPREQRQPQHLLGDLLVIALCSLLSCGRSFNDMEDYGEGHTEWLRTFLLLPQGISIHDTFNRVFAALDSHALEDALRQCTSQCEVPSWDMTLPEHTNALRQLAADGKRLRGSRRQEPGAEGGCRASRGWTRCPGVWSVQRGITVAQRRIPPAGGEIEQMPLLLRYLDLKGCVVSADAAHTQTRTAQVTVERGGEHVLCVKGNQSTTHHAVTEAMEAVRAMTDQPHFQSVEKGHGRLETQRCWVSGELAEFAPRGQWQALGSIALIESQREEFATGKASVEQRCYISSLGIKGAEEQGAARMAEIARSHWSVENALHWRLDVQ